MKKRICSVLTAVLLAVLLCVSVSAEPLDTPVVDAAGLLTEDQVRDLTDTAERIAWDTGVGVYLITVDDWTAAVPDAYDIEDAGRELYFGCELGEGDEDSGILLLLSMDQRNYAMYAFGFGNTAFTDYGKDYLAGSFQDDFGDDEWYDGLLDYFATSEEMILAAQDGDPVDVGSAPESAFAKGVFTLLGTVILLAIGAVIALLIRAVLHRQMRSVAAKTDADLFMTDDQLVLRQQTDRFTHSTQSRTYDPPSKSSDSDGGTTTDSSGGSSSSGSF